MKRQSVTRLKVARLAAASTIAACVAAAPLPAALSPAETSRETLTQTAFVAQDKPTALRQIANVEVAAVATLSHSPGDTEAQLTRAMATSYRAKLTNSRIDALSAKGQFEAITLHNPRDAEAQAALGAWHISAVKSLGGIVARGALGARKASGLEALDRAVALGGQRALFPGLAALLRLALDPKDPVGANLAETAAHGSTPTALDRILQRRAAQLLGPLKTGDARMVQALANRLLPLGQFK
ncbi:hypothetical protein [Sphingomonas sp. CARO-RG-8B-R24-01]|uniref:hypothetical protein n=1 Tax=Sphingomonas sp. CARO-RG-8B-R24-01 TaxID=2914831 RepID=UPI001F5AF5B2|nr:hypothetical protein [Sphingomonas sp. CARO-RG-8B-R24-01]